MLSQGDVISMPDDPRRPGGQRHFNVIISHPEEDEENIVLVPVISFTGEQDDRCVLESSDCPDYIKWRSCIEYRKANTATLGLLQTKLDSNNFSKKAPFGKATVEKILKGAKDAAQFSLPNKCSLVLSKQSLI